MPSPAKMAVTEPTASAIERSAVEAFSASGSALAEGAAGWLRRTASRNSGVRRRAMMFCRLASKIRACTVLEERPTWAPARVSILATTRRSRLE